MIQASTRGQASSVRSFWVAAGAASLILAAAGAGFHLLGDRLARTGATTTLPPGALSKFPYQMGDWTGQDLPIDASVVKATDTDDHVYRSYARGGGLEAVGFWFAFGIRGRDLAVHRPEVCYPGAGWTLSKTEDVVLPLRGGDQLATRILRFTRGALDGREMVVPNYFIVDGETCPDVTLLRSKIWRGSGAIRYMAQVQVTSVGAAEPDGDAKVAAVRAFAVESAGAVRSILPGARAPSSDGSVIGTAPAKEPS